MKKYVSLILCATLLFCFTACSKTKEKVDIPTIPPEKGIISENTYTNKYLDLKFTASSDSWLFATDEELALSCNIESEVFMNSEYEKLLKENPTVYDVIAQSETDKIAILVGIENPKLSAVSSSYSATDFVTLAVNSFMETIDTENNAYELSDIETTILDGHEYVRKTLTIKTDTEKASQTFYARSLGDYICVIIATYMDNTTIEQVEELFS